MEWVSISSHTTGADPGWGVEWVSISSHTTGADPGWGVEWVSSHSLFEMSTKQIYLQ